MDYDFVAWPASGYFPSTLFASGQAWNVTLDLEKYTVPELSALTVAITRRGGGKVWTPALRHPGPGGHRFAAVPGGRRGMMVCLPRRAARPL